MVIQDTAQVFVEHNLQADPLFRDLLVPGAAHCKVYSFTCSLNTYREDLFINNLNEGFSKVKTYPFAPLYELARSMSKRSF